MQVFLYSTIAVAGVRVLALIEWTRRDRFILTVALGIGFMDICQPDWFASILTYDGPNQSLVGLEQGINLAVETPFVISAIVGVFLNSVLPRDKASGPAGRYGDGARHPVIGERQDRSFVQ
jgi:xanthine/uracil permease